jgi:hypothetical protein
MGEIEDRIEAALAAYLDHVEMGGPEPDISHLSPSEQKELEELIRILDLTGGVALGLGRVEEEAERTSPPEAAPSAMDEAARSELGDRVLAQLKEALAPEVRVTPEATAFVTQLGGVPVLGGWLVGTFGGRVRVWLLDANAEELKENGGCLDDAGRVFRMLPDTAAIAMVGKDSMCLVVEPEDCAPHIQNPGGALVGRRYRRPIQPVGEAVAAFLHELIPYWDEVPAFDEERGITVDVPTIARQAAEDAIETQRTIGERARKANPKKEALLGLGPRESAALAKIAADLYDGKLDPDEAVSQLEKLVKPR